MAESLRDVEVEPVFDDFEVEATYRGSDCAKIDDLGEMVCGEFQVVLGDVLHNIRTALNYLAVTLAQYDSGQKEVGKTVQFPIDNSPKVFAQHRPTYLKGVSDEHVTQIERFQPYMGCDWMGVLRDLSNMDKHKALVVVYGQVFSHTEIPEADREADDDAVYVHRVSQRENYRSAKMGYRS